MKTHGKTKRTFNLIIKVSLIVLIAVAAIKTLFVGYDMDEQYAYAIAYRFLKKDIMIKEMWEPHQSSLFIQALMMSLYMRVFGTTGVILFSRTMGMVVHGVLMFLLYNNLKKRMAALTALASVAMIAFTIPKLMFTADFSNLLMWNLLIIILSFDAYYQKNRKKVYLIIAGTALMIAVLSYPSAVLLLIPCAIIVISFREDKKTFLKETALLALPCVLGLLIFGGHIMTNINVGTLTECLGYVLSDGSHSSDILSKIIDNSKSLLTVLAFGIGYGLAACAFCFTMRKRKQIKYDDVLWAVLFFSMIGQLIIWVFADMYINFPRVELFLISLYLFVKGLVKYKNLEYRKNYLLFTILPITAFLGVSVFTNHPFLVSAPFLSYVIAGFVIQTKDEDMRDLKVNAKTAIVLVGAFVILFGNIYLVRTADGTRCTLFDDVSLIRKGPAVGIIADDSIVVRYRDDYDLITQNVPAGSKVMYLGRDSDIYMFGDYEVCTPSTISTPTYSENVDAYYRINQEKEPQYVIYENAYSEQCNQLFGDEYEEITSNYFIHIMNKKQ